MLAAFGGSFMVKFSNQREISSGFVCTIALEHQPVRAIGTYLHPHRRVCFGVERVHILELGCCGTAADYKHGTIHGGCTVLRSPARPTTFWRYLIKSIAPSLHQFTLIRYALLDLLTDSASYPPTPKFTISHLLTVHPALCRLSSSQLPWCTLYIPHSKSRSHNSGWFSSK